MAKGKKFFKTPVIDSFARVKTLFGNEWEYFRPLLKRLAMVLAAFSISRILFLLFNYSSFEAAEAVDYLIALLHGIRFDISVLAYINSLFILLYLIPPLRNWKKILNALYLLTNGSVLLFNIIDIGYFPEAKKRSTLSLFGGNNDIISHSLSYLEDFWILLVLFVALLLPLFRLLKNEGRIALVSVRNYWLHGALSLLFVGFTVIGTRGGLQLKPLQTIAASYYGNPDLAQVTLNTPFVAMQAATQQALKPIHFMEEPELSNYFDPKHPAATGTARRDNVVILILESFSKEFMGDKGYLPFFDSLSSKGLFFENAFANGTRSIEALPSIFASIPSLANKAYLEMPYQDNALKALPYLLDKEGYSTAFFHGGRNGTMQFDAFCKRAGMKQYFGLNEYVGLPSDIDGGGWGVFDDPFLQFSAKEMGQLPQPFFASVFTLSTHHPYHVPESFRKRYPEEQNDFHRCLRYADESLRHFFELAKQQPWYDNTLFVLVADHTAAIEDPAYNTSIGLYRIPILFYQPAGKIPTVRENRIVQQVDIMPSVLDYLQVPKPYVAFGESVFQVDTNAKAVQNTGNYYQLIAKDRVLQLTEDQVLGMYKWEKDSIFATNEYLAEKERALQLEKELKAIVQSYTNSVIHNQLTIQK